MNPHNPSAGRRIVMKFGGSSVGTVEKLRQVADLVIERRRSGCALVVVVSAMGDSTNHLLEQARAVAREPHRRELDMLLSVGERISMALLALAIREAGLEAVSLTGSQCGIITTKSHARARIIEVRPFRVEDELDAGRIVIVAGYQGVSYTREITTLGRGGSDTTAVALAAALDADACEIYSDVDGVLDADPRVVPEARQVGALNHEEMEALAGEGAKVLNAQAVAFARARGIAIYARKTGSDSPGTVVRRDAEASPTPIRALAHRRQLLVASAAPVEPDSVDGLLSTLEALELEPRSFRVGDDRSLAMTLSPDDVHERSALEAALHRHLGPGALRDDLGSVSLVGAGAGHRPGLMLRAGRMTAAIIGGPAPLYTTPSTVTLLVPSEQVEPVIRALHAEFRPADGATGALPP